MDDGWDWRYRFHYGKPFPPLPDAPWIREAERDGMPSPPPVNCPVCGEECETVYMDRDGDVCACDICLRQQDAWEWQENERLADRPDWVDE